LSGIAPGEDENVNWRLTQSIKLKQITDDEDEKKKKQSSMAKCQAEYDRSSCRSKGYHHDIC
jgi:hypothetical protein